MKPTEAQDIPFLSFVNVLLRHWRLIFLTGIASAAVALAIVLVLGGYEAKAIFAPTAGNESALSGLAGVAARFGINVSADVGGSTGFYASLARADGLLQEVARTPYRFATRFGGSDSLRGSVLDLYPSRASTEEEKLQDAVDRLRRHVSVSVDLESGTVRVATRARWPGLAEQINRRILELVNAFNVDQLQSQARAERAFTEQRLQVAERELSEAEGGLERFLRDNRTYQSSPRLTFEAARLQRRVDLRQQVYAQLAGAYEQARIQEIRNTPVITIVDPPEGSARPRFRLLPTGLLALLGGVALGSLLAFLAEYFSSLRAEGAPEYETFRDLKAAVWRNLGLSRVRAKLGARREGGDRDVA